MAFDQATRNRLARFVGDARALLTAEFTRQLQLDYGMDPASGEVGGVGTLTYLDDARRETARLLRDTMAHYLAGSSQGKRAGQDVLDRIVREQAFTVLNRLCALRMAEARGLLIESVARGYQSKGFQLYARLAGPALGEAGDAYRSYLFSVFDEVAVDLPVLFDRFSPQGRLFPRESVLLQLLELINHHDLDPLWPEDETIGWIYQYFNSKEERKAMRDASQAPRNSRELAVRNQFFTPRYVVEFLTDNTLGRIWYEMTRGDTGLKDICRYLVRRPNEIFLAPGEAAPTAEEPDADLSQEELLRQAVYIPHRPLKDPRDLKMLDPACGSMHFGLYAFDLYERIYDEAWELEANLGPDAFTRPEGLEPIHDSYTGKDAFLKDVPRLIIERNIHGIDIDPRAVQIAGLSLWLRAQKTWHAQGLKPQDRPQIRRSNIVTAEPMPGERGMLEDFLKTLHDTRLETLIRRVMNVPEGQQIRATSTMANTLAELVRTVWKEMELAGEAGSLLKIEESLSGAVARGKAEWDAPLFRITEFGLARAATDKPKVHYTKLLPGEQADFWDIAEVLVLTALEEYAERADNDRGYQRRLFAEDAARGFAFIDLCRKRYNVVLMNPPFGLSQGALYNYLSKRYANSFIDLLASFVSRGESLAPDGTVGAITSRACLYTKTLLSWRKEQMAGRISTLIDLGIGVLDDAMVRACAYVIPSGRSSVGGCFIDARKVEDKASAVLNIIRNPNETKGVGFFYCEGSLFELIPQYRILYRFPRSFWEHVRSLPAIEPKAATIRAGLTTYDDTRFLRLRWEISSNHIGPKNDWVFLSKGGYFGTFYNDIHLVVLWANDGNEVGAYNRSLYDTNAQSRRGSSFYFRAAATYSRRTDFFSARALPSNSFFADKGPAIIPLNDSTPSYLLGVFNSDLYRGLVHSQSQGGCFETGVLKHLPWSTPGKQESKLIEDATQSAWQAKARVFCAFETDNLFSIPFSSQAASTLADCHDSISDTIRIANMEAKAMVTAINQTISKLFDLENRDFEDLDVFPTDHDIKEAADIVDELPRYAQIVISYLVGTSFGRWDIRFALGEKPPPDLPDPFAPLPICPPGMLQNDKGLPAKPSDVPADYPLRISWSGILIDDEGNLEDIERRVREVLQVIWKDRAEAVEHEASEILGVRLLRDYFRRPSGFFDDHLKRYSKSRRQAPIYWPLSTSSGSYTLWLYYHRLTDQTLYTCVNDFVDPKLKRVTEGVNALRQKGGRSGAEEKELERLSSLEAELKDFRGELLRITRFWKPNLNDGVQITAAPLWRLFQHRPWQKRLKETWEKLEAGDYDWAHLAYSIWPERVKEKCKSDKSLAIAHDLEELYVAPPTQVKKGRGRKSEQPDLGIK